MYPLLFMFAVMYLTFRMIRKDPDNFADITALKKEAHAFSGVNPDLFLMFHSNINLAQQYIGQVDISKKFLYISLQHLEDLGLSSETGDSGVQEEIANIVFKIGYAFEKILMNEALNQGVRFRLKYLNNRVED